MDVDKYYRSTLRELNYIADARVEEIKLNQMIQFSIYDSVYTQSGKKAFNQDFFTKRFPLIFKQKVITDADAANEFIKNAGFVKQE